MVGYLKKKRKIKNDFTSDRYTIITISRRRQTGHESTTLDDIILLFLHTTLLRSTCTVVVLDYHFGLTMPPAIQKQPIHTYIVYTLLNNFSINLKKYCIVSLTENGSTYPSSRSTTVAVKTDITKPKLPSTVLDDVGDHRCAPNLRPTSDA